MNEQIEKSLMTYEIAAKINPDFPSNLWNFVRCQSDHNISIEKLNNAISRNPGNPMLRRHLFWAYMQNDEVDLAKDQMIYALDHFHDKMTVGFAEMYASLGKNDEAIRWIKKAMALPLKSIESMFITVGIAAFLIAAIDTFDSFSFLTKSSIAILNSFDLSVINPDWTRNKIRR